MKYVSVFAALFLTLALVAPAGAAMPDNKTYRIDPAHTRVIFHVSHLGLMTMPGVAYGVSGVIQFDFRHAEASSVQLTIDPRLLTMHHAALDQKLQGKDFFYTEKYPEMRFVSTSIDKTGVDTARLFGQFTLRGVTRPIILEVKFHGRKWNKFAGTESAGFSATGHLRRSDFGMKSYLPDIGDEIDLEIQLEADEVRPAPAIPNGR